ncbi:MAG: hypothetical protein ACTSUB_04950 [Candidatus Thorarchaeota archaeon]
MAIYGDDWEELRMDFTLSLIISAYLATIALFIGLGIYIRRLRDIQDRITKPTERALIWYGIAGAMVGLLGLTMVIDSRYVLVYVSFMYAAFAISQLNLIVSNEKIIKRATIFLLVLAILAAAESILRRFTTVLGAMPPFILAISMVIFIGGTFLMGFYLLKESPSPFTVSTLILLFLIVISAFTSLWLDLTSTPEYFTFLIAPYIIMAAVMGSMMRPWRQIGSISIGLFAIITAISLAIPAFIDGNINILLFAIAAGFAATCIVAPFDFFSKQAIDTGAKTPIYITITMLFIALLSITHASNYAISVINFDVWDPMILYMDWIFGVIAVSTFTLASYSTTASENARNAVKEILIALAAALVVLGHPYIQGGRWELEILYLVLIFLLVIAITGYIRLSRQLLKLGSGGVAGRFLAFMFAGLGIGLVTMFADEIGITLLFPILIGAGLLLLVSNPGALQRFRKQ